MTSETLKIEVPNNILNMVSEVFNTMKDSFEEVINQLKEINNILKETVQSADISESLASWDSLLGILTTIGTVIGGVIAGILVAAGVIVSLPADAAIAIGGAIGAAAILLIMGMVKLIQIIVDNWDSICNFWIDACGWIVDAVSDMIVWICDIISPIVTWINNNIITPIIKAFAWAWENISNAVGVFIGFVPDISLFLYSWLEGVIRMV